MIAMRDVGRIGAQLVNGEPFLVPYLIIQASVSVVVVVAVVAVAAVAGVVVVVVVSSSSSSSSSNGRLWQCVGNHASTCATMKHVTRIQAVACTNQSFRFIDLDVWLTFVLTVLSFGWVALQASDG